jgi:hypothetical protein
MFPEENMASRKCHSIAASAVAAALVLGVAACGPIHGRAHSSGPAVVNMQGDDIDAFFRNPHVRAYYDLTVEAFAKGADKVDFPDYERKSFAIFRALGASMGGDPEGMQDHLKLIPGQMMKIVAEDPAVLKDYESFRLAMVGPP